MNYLDAAARRMFDRMPRTHRLPENRRELMLKRTDAEWEAHLESLLNCDEAMRDVLQHGYALIGSVISDEEFEALAHLRLRLEVAINRTRRGE